MKTAEFQTGLGGGKVRCDLCPHHCVLTEGQTGKCRARGVHDGELKALWYGCLSAANIDPIEKKPLYHFHPGSEIFSMGGWGCNFSCDFCQNWTISQRAPDDIRSSSAERIVRQAAASGSVGIAYTYNEPTVGYEFMRDCAILAHEADLANVMVTNGYMEREPAERILPLIDALNVDIKSLSDDFYRVHCGGRLAPVLRFCAQAVKAGRHLEITNLVIPGLNDGEGQIRELAKWIGENLGSGVPLHLSAHHPDHKLMAEATPASTIARALEISRESLTYVYAGNISVAGGSDTKCPRCGALLIKRRGYDVRVVGLSAGGCEGCGRAFDGRGPTSDFHT